MQTPCRTYIVEGKLVMPVSIRIHRSQYPCWQVHCTILINSACIYEQNMMKQNEPIQLLNVTGIVGHIDDHLDANPCWQVHCIISINSACKYL